MKNLVTRNKVQELQQAIARKSKSEPRIRFYSLYDKVYRADVLLEAWKGVRKNKGAAGCDGTTLKEIERNGVEQFLSQLQRELKTQSYSPQPLKRVYIPKANGKKRPLSIPTVRDRVVQQAVRIVIEPIFEAHFSSSSFGYRPHRGAQGAVREIRKFLNWGLVQVIESDIEDCFGTIPHAELMRCLAERIADGKILKLIRSWLRCGVMEEGRIRTQIAGTPQGGVISPLLANVYLDQLDQRWKQKKMDGNYYNAHPIRYCDDLVILTNRSPKEPERILKETLKGMGLKVNESKTRVLDARKETFDFLGFSFRQCRNPRTGKWFPLTKPSRKAQKSLRRKLKALTSRGVQKKVSEVVQEINPVLRGWVNYFRIGHSARDFGKIRKFTLCRLLRFVRRKQNRKGYGWKDDPSLFFYGTLGLFYDYHLERLP